MEKKPFKEGQSVRITVDTRTDGYNPGTLVLPAGSDGAIIEVFGDPDNPSDYMVEFYIPETDECETATLPPEHLKAEYTPEEEAILDHYGQMADEACNKVHRLDPNWLSPDYWADTRQKPPPTFLQWIAHLQEVIAAAQARLEELRARPKKPPAKAANPSES